MNYKLLFLPLCWTSITISLSPYRAKWVVVDGVEYKRDAGVVYSITEDLPQIVKIEVIYILNGSTVLFKGHYFTTSYISHYHAYTLHSLHRQSYFYHHQLAFHVPLHIRTPRCLPHESVVIMPFSIS